MYLFAVISYSVLSTKRISKRAAGTNADGGDSTSRELKYEPLQFSDGDVQFTNSNGPPVSVYGQ